MALKVRPVGGRILVESAEENHKTALTIKEAKGPLALSKAKSKERSDRLAVKRRLSNFAEFVRASLHDWTPEEREVARLAILQFAEEIASYESAPLSKSTTHRR